MIIKYNTPAKIVSHDKFNGWYLVIQKNGVEGKDIIMAITEKLSLKGFDYEDF